MTSEIVLSDEKIKTISDKLKISTDEEREDIIVDILDNVNINPENPFLEKLKVVMRKYDYILTKLQKENKKN